MPEWLERELARELKSVEAPDDLWQRVHAVRGAVTVRGRARPPALFLAAAAMLLLTAGALWLWGNPARNPVPQPTASGSCYACHMSL